MLSMAFSACTGGGGEGEGGEGGSNTGQFIDSLVEGLEYSSSSKSGLTDLNGNFDYTPGQETTFKVGDIILGSLTPSRVVSPVEFLGAGAFLDDDDKVLNIARFLQTIDEDNFPANGITISPETRLAAIGKSVNFDQSTSAWESDTAVINTIASLTPNPIVSEAAARDHILAWIAASKAGEYGGSWSDPLSEFSGDWRLSVSTSAEVILIANYEDNDFGGVGDIDGSDGSFTVKTEYAVFQGAIIGTEISGTFVGLGEYDGINGEMSGGLLVQPMTFLDLDLLEDYMYVIGEEIGGDIYDETLALTGQFFMYFYPESYGRYEVFMSVDLGDIDLYMASFYVTSMSSSQISFRGLCTSGEGFSAQLSSSGTVSGTYYNLSANGSFGTFYGVIFD